MARLIALQDVPKFGMKDKLGYLFGDFGCVLNLTMVRSFYMVFYVTILGLSPVIFGGLMIALRVWDAINDILIGAWADKYVPKKVGTRFRPWLTWGALGLVLSTSSMFVTWTNFFDLGTFGLAAFAFGTYAIWTLVYSAANIPYGAMAASMTTDVQERAELSKFRAIGSLLGNIPTGVLAPIILYDAVTNNPIGERFLPLAAILAIIGSVFIILCARMCSERVVHNIQPNETNAPKQNVFKTFFSALCSRPMFGLILATSAVIMFLQANGVINQYLFMLHYERTELIATVNLLGFIPQITMMLFLGPLIKKFGRLNLTTWPFLAIAVIGLAIIILPMRNPYVMIGAQFIIGMLQAAFLMLMWALINDVIDYMDVRLGRREESTVYSIVTFFRKLCNGFSMAFIGLGLSIVGYVPDDYAALSDNVGNGIKNLTGVFFLCGGLIIFIAMKFIYNLSDAEVKKIQQQIIQTNDEQEMAVNEA